MVLLDCFLFPEGRCILSPPLILSRGGYSSVVLGTHVTTGVKRAIKIIDKSKLTDQLSERVKRECDINFMVSHPNIAQVYEIYESPEDLSLVMELFVSLAHRLHSFCAYEINSSIDWKVASYLTILQEKGDCLRKKRAAFLSRFSMPFAIYMALELPIAI